MPEVDSTDQLHPVVEGRLQRRGQRYTAGRRAIVDLLAQAGDPVSIGDIALRLPGLPRSSAYRHLVDLQAAGVVHRLAAGDEFTRFELAEDLTEHHHHLLCSGCGRIVDITPPPGLERSLARHLQALATATGFELHGHRVDLIGTCTACR